jgi:MFS family permease
VDGNIGAHGPTPAEAPHVPLARRHLIAASIGNALEFYDFVTYSFFALQIGRTFFPSHDAYASLMLSLATFGAGFVTRPIGALVIGAYADRVGRRPAMVLSFTMMGAAIIVLALIPPYSAIGVAAPILAVACRMAQGFSLGGEVGPSTAYLLESAPPGRRGVAVSWGTVSQNLAATTGGLVGVGLSSLMSSPDLDRYGWRIAFLLGAVSLPFGLWLRRNLPETLRQPDAAPAVGTGDRKPRAVRDNLRVVLLGLLVLSAATIGNYVFNYMTTYAQSTLRMPSNVAFLADALGNLAGSGALALGGWLSDKIGRRPVMLWSNLVNLLLIAPVFAWIVTSHSVLALLTGAVALGVAAGVTGGAFYVAISESLPKAIRGAGFGMIYAVAIALFGGTAQLVVTWLTHITGDAMAPAWYLVAAALVGQLAFTLFPESAPGKLAPRAPGAVSAP